MLLVLLLVSFVPSFHSGLILCESNDGDTSFSDGSKVSISWLSS